MKKSRLIKYQAEVNQFNKKFDVWVFYKKDLTLELNLCKTFKTKKEVKAYLKKINAELITIDQ